MGHRHLRLAPVQALLTLSCMTLSKLLYFSDP